MKKNEVELMRNAYNAYAEAQKKIAEKEKELEEQKQLDFQKWLESERRETDLSGIMPYCAFCPSVVNFKCMCNPEIRESEVRCAKAYDRMKENLKK